MLSWVPCKNIVRNYVAKKNLRMLSVWKRWLCRDMVVAIMRKMFHLSYVLSENKIFSKNIVDGQFLFIIKSFDSPKIQSFSTG
jgi:hypothetical protein